MGLDGLDELLAALNQQIERVMEATPDGLSRAAHDLQDAVKAKLSLTSHPPRTKTPSRPGEPPSLISGRLRDSVTIDGPTGGGGRWSTKVYPSTVYARIQELGGICGAGYRTQLPARPYLAPALAESLDGIADTMTATWAAAIDR